jgi:hypothetical protein
VSKTCVDVSLEGERTTVEWTQEEKTNLAKRYGCQILLENSTMGQIKDPSFPSDAYIIEYVVDGELRKDLCRGKRSSIFDLYYDKFGKGSIQKIDFGYGRVSPKLWGYKQPEGKKRK